VIHNPSPIGKIKNANTIPEIKAAVARKALPYVAITLDNLFLYHVENEKDHVGNEKESQTSHISESKHIS